jgi:hypothetical protein
MTVTVDSPSTVLLLERNMKYRGVGVLITFP